MSAVLFVLSVIPYCVKSNIGTFSGDTEIIFLPLRVTRVPAPSSPVQIKRTMFTAGVSEFLVWVDAVKLAIV